MSCFKNATKILVVAKYASLVKIVPEVSVNARMPAWRYMQGVYDVIIVSSTDTAPKCTDTRYIGIHSTRISQHMTVYS